MIDVHVAGAKGPSGGAEALKVTTGGLRAVYRTLELPGKHPLKDAHAALDAAVLAAYGFGPKKDLLEQLLALNLDVAARIAGGQPVTPPGVTRRLRRSIAAHHRRLHQAMSVPISDAAREASRAFVD